MTRPRRGSAISAVFTVSAFAWACGSGEEAAAPPVIDVVVAEVDVRDVPVTREWAAQTSGIQDVEIRARVRGFLRSRDYREGSEVQAGDLLFTIDPQEYEAEVAQARARLAEAEAGLARADGDVARLGPLAARNAVSQQDLDYAVAEQQAAKGRVAAEQAVLNSARLNLGYTRVTSPITGTAGVANVDVGSLVVPSPDPTLLTVVSQIDSIKASFRISEQEYLQLARARGEEARSGPSGDIPIELVLADGSTHAQTGQVRTVDRNVDPTTGTLGIEAVFPNPERLLRPGQFGRVRAPVATREDAILVPQRAVRELQGTYNVGVLLPDSTVEIRPVRAGERIGNEWVIDDGLEAGEVVVVEGMEKVRPGLKVRSVPDASGGDAAPAEAAGRAGS
jgi:membrane fusion protein (multidrug efflux system)